ncbi:hypothetical protein HTSR_0609 [Halodesulfurarchaeum formicicum]|uniref:Uncharacterized protein n=1 Tax=Halodesulfurarchaeum formicicum TaxID=1873524 RepID=A0A1D8S380_9EURY|nr:DUF5804 family protein [Halodesulfurarchaeum formicicum]AOW79803.1 hypothetical protein HTSR_0609 [Halodesulfurarchaeum formicicum]APE95058.1 hypothetical protein HSR6_0597 [Halodesulfurarchaeum formicicum]
MTEVCLRGQPETDIQEALLAYETARSALAPYQHHHPFENTIAVETVSLGAAISLLNDLDWYLARTTQGTLLRDPSVSTSEWLSRDLAEQVRNGEIPPDATGQYLKVYGLADRELIEPMYVTRREDSIPAYDLADVEATVVVRVTEREFERG